MVAQWVVAGGVRTAPRHTLHESPPATELRLGTAECFVIADAAVLAFLAVASVAHWRVPGKLAIVGILVLNLTGIGLNYGVFRSQQYDLSATRIAKDYSQPAYVYSGVA